MNPIKLQKGELSSLLLNITTFDAQTGQIVGGLLSENLTLGTKRALDKIRKALIIEYQELEAQIKEVKESCKDDKEKLHKELEELFKETVEISVPRFKFEKIEEVSSNKMYDFDLLEKISE